MPTTAIHLHIQICLNFRFHFYLATQAEVPQTKAVRVDLRRAKRE
jgi:hypothetical protein